jgi:hypothetical protein
MNTQETSRITNRHIAQLLDDLEALCKDKRKTPQEYTMPPSDPTGWVKLHRKLEEWEWYTDSKSVHLFVHLLIKANHKPRKWRGIDVQPGQLVTSRDRLSMETGISTQSVRTILERLKSTSEITSKSTSTYTLITICKWATYQTAIEESNQQINQPPNKPVTNEQPATNQQLTTNKNVETVDNGKNGKTERTRESMPEVFVQFIESKGHLIRDDLQMWRAAWGAITARCDKPTDVFEWAVKGYDYPVKQARYFVKDSWPSIYASFQANGKSWYDKIKG